MSRRRYLVVGGCRLDEPAVREAIVHRLVRGPAVFHIVVPAACSSETRRLVAMAGDPLSGYVGALAGLEQAMERDRRAAADQLARAVRWLSEAGAESSGEVGRSDPLRIVARELRSVAYDEVVVAVGSSRVERFLRIDLSSRLRRSVRVPVADLGVPDTSAGARPQRD